MHTIHTIDLKFQKVEKTIASFLIQGKGKPVLIETGPHSTWNQLKSSLQHLGFKPKDLAAVLLTHIHFDHAGAAWEFAKAGVKVYLHPKGITHLSNPIKLWNSAAKIYGDEKMDTLWGPMESIDPNFLVSVDDMEDVSIEGLTFTSIHSPGHASHHIAWQLGESVFTGDVGGVKIKNGPVVPPCPPPDIHIEAWKSSIEKISDCHPKELYLTHFGKISNPQEHLSQLISVLDDWAIWIKRKFDQNELAEEITPEFMNYTAKQLENKGAGKDLQKLYELANPSWMSVGGLLRYWKLKTEGRL
ncbi:MBL fold metallo-hydrolase [Cyclobacterium marinum]|uniref:Beta-lactamase n=1 Tax=Cyclobacterium marinum (strain ATCC 25205 / DSM 745 / LMG 13164 / NCIMB 1802) TaxID=880070 RepID=G0J0R7_CYCMS|nr:MBL fold metallo-hydrolase [Cyclobacterium marinum]AEL24479.1 beta-lactamase [Cyclobacterium marinum DSM 745]MBI0399140.1 MBL fold metallo-hydrolase [Cyclobacterium marinum]MBR9775833.1 MBL fold metallo-hydrolase [Cytophagales bacterium]|tara:strand:- start:10247 stop:11149 length:903 start_codon:yes stop_codon:yes gene_type:complete